MVFLPPCCHAFGNEGHPGVRNAVSESRKTHFLGYDPGDAVWQLAGECFPETAAGSGGHESGAATWRGLRIF